MQPRRYVGFLDQGERHDGTGEYDGIELAERRCNLADDTLDRGGVGYVEFVSRTVDLFGELRQKFHSPGCQRDVGASGVGRPCQSTPDA
jgi:hypothetical protein